MFQFLFDELMFETKDVKIKRIYLDMMFHVSILITVEVTHGCRHENLENLFKFMFKLMFKNKINLPLTIVLSTNFYSC